jgi:pimeloyl-ACP methyl ester carboxylesterase
MERTRLEVQAPDGRKLAVEVAGPADGDVVVYHTGTPSAASLFEPLLEAGAERGLRHVCYCRPGYAGSDRQPGRSVADCARDAATIADQLGIERFYTAGQSGGGPHALACGALLADRVIAVATTASPAPYDVHGLDWLAGMGEENVQEVAAFEEGEEVLQAFIEAEAEKLRSVTADDILEALGDLVSAPDRAVLTGAFAESQAASLHTALSNGIWGWFDDDLAMFGDWGFDLGAIEVPVTIWQGEDDRMVPFAHGRWLAENVRGVSAQLVAGEGHYSLRLGRYGDVLDGLIASRA